MTKRVIFAEGPDALRREGLSEKPEMWEDGRRVEPLPGSFEWWYFEAHLDDGSSVAITFSTKPLLDRRSRLKPAVSITVTTADGRKLSAVHQVAPGDFSASKERCYVRAGESWVRGDLCFYELKASAGELSAQLNFSGMVPAWRPGAGKTYYDEGLTRYFAWLPAIPHGTVEGQLTFDGKMRAVQGTCYHDHSWGNADLNEVLSSWYWGHAHLGDYTLIFAEMRAAPRYNEQKIPIFLLAKGGQVLIGDGAPLLLEEQDFIADPDGRSYPDGLDLRWEKDGGLVTLKLRAPSVTDSFSLLEMLPRWQQVTGKLLVNPYYFRFQADLDLQVDLGDHHAREQGRSVYELALPR